jgi:hypothetical protein
MPKEFLTAEQINKENKKRGIEVGVPEEKLGVKEDVLISKKTGENKVEKETPESLYSKEMDEQILDLSKSFSKELVDAADGIMKYQLPRIDSFLVNLEKENPENYRLLKEKRDMLGHLMKEIFRKEQIRRRREMNEEDENKKEN